MQKKAVSSYIFTLLCILSFHDVMYGVAAYMPETIRGCIARVYADSKQKISNDFQELYAMISQNRVIASEELVRKVTYEALNLLKADNNLNNGLQYAASAYLEEYLKHLPSRAILLHIQGNDNALLSLPTALVARSLKTDSMSREMMQLSSELASIQNIEICGNVEINTDVIARLENIRSAKPTALSDPGIVFNANMFTNVLSSSPTVIFGTGVSSPIINAWAMPKSSSTQSPINMQFSIPGDFKTERALSIQMHFLVKKQFISNGNAKIRINALYVSNEREFSEAIDFTYTNESDDFVIIEPTHADELMHIAIDVPIEKSGVDRFDFAVISLSRIPTDGVEYAGNIYLASAAFRYTPKS